MSKSVGWQKVAKENSALGLTLDRELDVLMLGCMFPQYCSVTAKSSLKYYPFLGWFSTWLKV